MQTFPTDRTSFTAAAIVEDIWCGLGLPKSALRSLSLPGDGGLGLPSSFKVGRLAQASIALSALSAAQIHALKTKNAIRNVTVPLEHAVAEFKSERLYILDGKRNEDPWGPVGGLHKTKDGYVRIHDSFPNHRHGALAILGLEPTASRADVANKCLNWRSEDLENEAVCQNVVIAALRSYKHWEELPQAHAISDSPIQVTKVDEHDTHHGIPGRMMAQVKNNRLDRLQGDKCLRGLRVLELSRVIAAPLAGKTLAAHGADVMWITSPNLPDLPEVDRDMARGKRTVYLDLCKKDDRERLLQLARDADVFIQGYRPGSLSAFGLSTEDLQKLNPKLIYASMSAYGPNGPWANRRGFDSIVQTCSGMNVSEAEHFHDGSPARPTPCQALDHAGGYFLAAGIMTALYRQSTEGGRYTVDVSLAGVMKYLRSLGQYPGRTGFDCQDITKAEDAIEYMETRMTGFGELTAMKHSARIEGVEVGWDVMPKPLGSDQAVWNE